MVQYKVDSVAKLVDAVRSARPGDSIELCRSAFSHWGIGLSDGGWRLTDGHESVLLDQAGGARMRFVLDGASLLLAGENGQPSIQSAIDAATGGETILVAPGTYGEGRPFVVEEMGCPEAEADSYGLVINKPVTLQGVSESGAWITDCDDVDAAAVALFQSRDGVSFAVTAPGVSIRGLGFVPAGSCRGAVVNGRTFSIYRHRFGLHASVVERDPVHGSVSAIHFPRRGSDDPGHEANITGNILYGSITLDATSAPVPMDVVIVGNDIHGDLLPPVLVTCHGAALSAVPVHPLLPVMEDNALRTSGKVGFAFAVQFDGPADEATPGSNVLGSYIRKVLESHDGAGAVIVDLSGQVRTCLCPRFISGRGKAPVAGIYASIQAAINDASQGDTLHVGAGIYRERLALSGKHLALAGATDVHGDPLVKLLPPEWSQLSGGAGGGWRHTVINLSSHPTARLRQQSPGRAQEGRSSAEAGSSLSEVRQEEGSIQDAAPKCDALADERVLDLLDSYASLALPVRHFGRDGRQKGALSGVQEAIDVAHDGDRIEIAPGSFTGDLHVTRPLTLLGANAGRPGSSGHRGLESVILGDVTICPGSAEVVIDGLTIRGSVTSRVVSGARSHLALRCCVINASGLSSAISILSGTGTMIASNLIISGSEEGIYAPFGFDDLVISGNRLEIAEGAAGIVLNTGAGTDSVYILGNTAIGGDYGILVEGDSGLDGPGDSITIAGNCFGELHEGRAVRAPAVAAICADRPVSRALERSLGACLESNVYNLSSATLPVDIAFESGSGAQRQSGQPDTLRSGQPRR